MEEEKILNVTQLGVVDKLQNEDVILLIRNTDNGKQCFQIKGSDFRGESAYEAALSQGFEGTYSEWVQQIKEVTEYDTKTLLSFKGIASNDANKALTSGIYPNVTANIPITGETFTVQTLRTTTAVYNQYVSTQIAIGVTGAAIGKVYIRKNTQKSGAYTLGDWIKISHEASTTKKKNTKTQYVIGKAIPIGKLNGGARLNAYAVSSRIFRFKLSRILQLGDIIRRNDFAELEKLLENVTWHLFLNDRHITDSSTHLNYGGHLQEINAGEGEVCFYKLDESKSSVDLSSDMYIYLRAVSAKQMRNFKGTSETLYYCNSKRIWEPFINSPSIDMYGYFNIDGSYRHGDIQLQKLLTRQRRSKHSGLGNLSISKFGYRGRRDQKTIDRGGYYRYRIVLNGKKTQWRTINILKKDNHFLIK